MRKKGLRVLVVVDLTRMLVDREDSRAVAKSTASDIYHISKSRIQYHLVDSDNHKLIFRKLINTTKSEYISASAP